MLTTEKAVLKLIILLLLAFICFNGLNAPETKIEPNNTGINPEFKSGEQRINDGEILVCGGVK